MFDGCQQAVIGLGRLRSLMRTPAGTPPAEHPRPVRELRGDVEFDGVSFGYAGGGGPEVLHGLSLRIAPDESVALVGGTVRDAIVYVRPDATDAEVEAAARTVGARLRAPRRARPDDRRGDGRVFEGEGQGELYEGESGLFELGQGLGNGRRASRRPAAFEQLDSQLGADKVRLSRDVLDRIDEIVPPGTNLFARDVGYTPSVLTEPALRRRSGLKEG